MPHSWTLSSILTLVLICPLAIAEDWPQILGPHRNGIVPDTGLNVDWKMTPPKTLWKVPIGHAYSSVAIVGDRLYTMAQRGKRDIALCLDAKSGKELWSYDAVPSYIDVQKQGAGPRATPTYHQGKLYCLFARGELLCLTDRGKKVWQRNMFTDTGAKSQEGEFYYWGVSMSPLVEGEAVIVQPGGDKNNSVAAYHKDTGKLLWTVGEDPMGYASPISVTIDGSRQVVVPTGQSILGIEPSKGKILWRYPFGNRFNVTCAIPVWKDNLLFVSAAYGGGCAALEIFHRGKSDESWIVQKKWTNKKELQNLMATSMIVDGYIYGCHGDLAAFFLRCLDQKTGQVKWEKRVQGRYSFLALDKHILCWHERGNLSLIEATPAEFRVKAELPKLLAHKCWTMPAFANGKLYLRDEHHLLCLDLRKE
jgi:outer membrane protein assembly factor BamB